MNDPEIRQALLSGQISVPEAKRRLRERSGQTSFGINLKLPTATVMLRFNKPRVKKTEVLESLKKAKSATASLKAWPPRQRYR